MNRFQEAKQEIQKLCRQVEDHLGNLETLDPGPGENLRAWNKDLEVIKEHLSSDTVRVAVVGAIKSGKSTLVNSLLRKDYLKRGAGVITSIVTRVRCGGNLAARLYFKSWDEINQEMERALVLLPSGSRLGREEGFDIRRQADRNDLRRALDELDAEAQVLHDSLNANVLLLKAYLEGYSRVENMVQADNAVVDYGGDQFHLHRDFVARDALAVYLKDLLLIIDNQDFEEHIEFADCQGSDSPNPLHLAMIQDYLLITHLVIYVISSRMGLREADIRFLSMLKKMGMAANLVFVLNCDLGEHSSMDEIDEMERKVSEQLALLVDGPRVYTFSALYRLLNNNSEALSLKDQRRLEQWRLEQEMVRRSEQVSGRFLDHLEERLNVDKYSLLLENQLQRLEILLARMIDWARLHRDLAIRGQDEVKGLVEKLAGHQGHMRQIRSMINNTIDGAVHKIKSAMKTAVERYFEGGDTSPAKAAMAYVDRYQVEIDKYRQSLSQSGFTATVYLVFQEIRQAVDRYLTESLNPGIIKFVQEAEQDLKDRLARVSGPYRVMIAEAMEAYSATLSPYGLKLQPGGRDPDTTVDLEEVKQIIGLQLPPARANLRYSANIKTEAVMRLGLYTAVKIFRQIFKHEKHSGAEHGLQALSSAGIRMKKEIKKSLSAQFKDYKENIKFQYLLRLVDAAAARQKELMSEQFDTYLTDLGQTLEAISGTHQERDRYADCLKSRIEEIEDMLLRARMLGEGMVELKASRMAN